MVEPVFPAVLFPVAFLDFLCTARQVSSRKRDRACRVRARTLFRFRLYKRKIGLLIQNDPRRKSKKWPKDVVYVSSHLWLWSVRLFARNWSAAHVSLRRTPRSTHERATVRAKVNVRTRAEEVMKPHTQSVLQRCPAQGPVEREEMHIISFFVSSLP